jgi:hypothetical protein
MNMEVSGVIVIFLVIAKNKRFKIVEKVGGR